MTDLVDLARSRVDSTQRTHWEGCERDHRECLVQRMADEIERLRALLPLTRYGAKVIEAHREDCGDLDGGWLQDTAETIGLLAEIKVTEPCGEECRCLEYYGADDWPVECLRYTRQALAGFAMLAALARIDSELSPAPPKASES